MGKLMWFVVIVAGCIALYVSWPDIMSAMAPGEDAEQVDEVKEGLRKMGTVYTGNRDPNYHCHRKCPERIGGTSSPVPIEKAEAMRYTPCEHCCGE